MQSEAAALISPDGDRLLYVATDRSIRIVPFAGGEARKVPGAPLEREDLPVQWDADGRTLYVWRRGDLPAAVDKLDLTTGRRLPWKQLMPADLAGVISIRCDRRLARRRLLRILLLAHHVVRPVRRRRIAGKALGHAGRAHGIGPTMIDLRSDGPP